MRTNIGNNTVLRRAYDLERTEIESATFTGVGIKTLLLLFLTLISALTTIFVIGAEKMISLYIIIVIITFVLGMIIAFSPRAARMLAVPYAILEGMAVGAISGAFAYFIPELGLWIPGIALALTMVIFLGATVLYTTGVIRVGNFFRRLMFILLLGAVLVTFLVMIVGFFAPTVRELFFGVNSGLALGISIIMVIISSLYILISLDNATKIVNNGLDKVYEWYAAYGIILNIIWLYLEILRLVFILAARDR